MSRLLETTVSEHVKKLSEYDKLMQALGGLAFTHEREIESLKKQIKELSQRLSATEQQLAEVRTNAC